jgi:hypothetical protein
MPFKEIIAVQTENHKNSWIQNAECLMIKEAGRYIYHSAFKG